jgi:uncharacterized protein with FMN-binding domain
MLSLGKKRESLMGKLLLSSALVAMSLAYGWWQRDERAGGAPVQMTSMPAPKNFVAVPKSPAMTASHLTAAPAAPRDPEPAASDNAQSVPAPLASIVPKKLAMAAPPTQTTIAPSASAVPQPEQTVLLPASSPSVPLTTQAALAMYLPTNDVSPPLPLVTGTPAPGAAPPIPAGTHLEDGDYLSDKHEFEWGDLVVKVSIHGGQITGVQILQYPDHRSQSLYLSQMAGPLLESEVIKSQQSQVDAVSSATDTSYAFQDTIANAIVKATRG